MIASLSPPSPPHHHKRPRGLWKGHRETAASKLGLLSHDFDLESLSASTSSHDGDTFDDDFDDGHSSDSSYKRRRLSGGLSDTDTLWQHSPALRSLTPDLSYHAPSFPSHNLKSPPYSPLKKPITIMYANSDVQSSINSNAKGKQPSTTDLEDWQNLKELFARASDSYDSDDTAEALPLLRAVIRECHRFMREHPDPSLVYAESSSLRESLSPASMMPTEEPFTRDWTPESLDAALRPLRSPSSHPQTRHHHQSSVDPPTAFHAIFGTALYYMGTIVSQDPTVALPDEPSTAPTYWLAALDVFETGENLPSVIGGSAKHPEDWRMAVSWGRTLISLAEEKLNQTLQAKVKSSPFPSQADIRSGVYNQQAMSSGPFSIVEPRWPPTSPFHAIAASRPPVTRRMSLLTATAHDIMVLAMDQFSRGIFHMPHPRYSQTHNPTALHLEQSYFLHGSGFSTPLHTREHSSSLSPPPGSTVSTGSSVGATLPSSFSRPKELFMIASEVLGLAERLSKASQREYWAAQADSVFNQMKMEADMSEWRMAVNAARGRCWLVVGEARAEEMEDRLEKGDLEVLHTAEAEEAREGLAMAVTFFECAKGSATAKPNPDEEDLSPLLAEALLTLANLTLDENSREELYARAQAEGGDSIELDLDPPPKALPAAISTIAVATNRQPAIPPLDTVVDKLDSPARTRSLSMEALPTGRAFQPMSLDNALGLDQPMTVDSATRKDDAMDES